MGINVDKIRYFRTDVLRWFHQNSRNFHWRNKSRTPYEIVMSEILLQRTRAETVQKYYMAFLRKYPSWSALALARRKTLFSTLRPFGLWRQRAIVLQSLSRVVQQGRGRLPAKRNDLEKLPGIGQYIASAVLAICHDKREPLLDVNMARLLERYFGPRILADIRYDPYLQTLSRRVLPNKNVKQFNWAMLDFASMVCTETTPSHERCPLRKHCKYWREQSVNE